MTWIFADRISSRSDVFSGKKWAMATTTWMMSWTLIKKNPRKILADFFCS